MTSKPRKLSLQKTTLANLRADQLVDAAGARKPDDTVGRPCSFSCENNSHCCSGHFTCNHTCY